MTLPKVTLASSQYHSSKPWRMLLFLGLFSLPLFGIAISDFLKLMSVVVKNINLEWGIDSSSALTVLAPG